MDILGFFVCLVVRLLVLSYTTVKNFTFSRIHKPNRVPEIYCLSGKYKLFIPSFLEYCYTIDFVQGISRHSKECVAHDRNDDNFFLALNLTIICIKIFTCNNATSSASFLNEILFLHSTFSSISFKHFASFDAHILKILPS